MIRSFRYRKKVFSFLDENTVDYNQNIFTVLIGKNGTGKSRLLSFVVRQFIRQFKPNKSTKSWDFLSDHFEEGSLDFSRAPNKVIAVSTSPFDKFPISRFKRDIEGYSYLGIREFEN